MQNIDVRFSATSNFGKVEADLAALKAEAAALSKVFTQNAYAQSPALVDPARWKVASSAVHRASNEFRNAAASSGAFTTQQIRATSEAEKFTKALQKQKLSFGDMRKNWNIMKEVYRDQLRYQRMTAQHWGSDAAGRGITDIAIPKQVPADLDNMRRKMGMFGNMAASAGTQIVNLGKNIQWSGRQLTVGFTYPMAMFGAAAGVMAYKVEDAFGSINKVYDVSAKAQQNDALRTQELSNLRIESMDMAKQAAKEYGSAITDTLAIEQQLAATGMTMADGLLDATKNVQRIAAIGDIDATQTADMVVALGTAFKLSGQDMTDTLNYMNAASNATSLSLQDIAEATPRAASAMSALGVSAKQMTVLLVSMREAGVDAAEGANALKSATGTILAPSPAALKFIEEVGGGKLAKGFENIAKSSGGNLYVAMQQMYKMTEGLTKLERQQILVKLFGKYQFNRVSAMLDNLGAAFEGTQNQARKAMDLMGQSSKENAEQAAKSLKDMTDTAAGRFRSAWEGLKGELADLGTPFLEVANKALEAATKVAHFFNGMDDWKKKAILGGLALTALVGPAVMLVGLMMNLTGQFVKGVGAIAKFVGISTLVTKQEQAEALATEAANKALASQTQHTMTLTEQVRILTAAMEQATIASREYAGLADSGATAQAAAAEKSAAAVVENEAEKRAAMTQTYEQQIAQAAAMASYGQYQPVKPPTYAAGAVAPVPMNVRDFRGNETTIRDVAATQAAQKAAEAEAAAMNRAAAARAEQVNKTNAQLAVQNKVKDSVTGTGIAMGVMSGAMAATLISSNHVVDSIAKWAMIGTMAVPAMQAVGGFASKIGSGMGTAISATRTATTGMTALGGAMATARAGAVGFGVALNAALGPIGWIALGLTAVVGTFMAIKSHNDKIKAQQEAIVEKQIEANKVMNESTASIATNLGKAAGSYEQIVNAGGAASGGKGSQSQMLKAYNYYKGDEGGKELGALQSDGKLLEADALMTKIRGKFIDLQVLGNDTAEQARTDIQAMLMAAGSSSEQAMAMADEVYKKYGNVKKIDWAGPIKDQTDALTELAGKAFQLETSVVTGGGMATILTDFKIDEGQKKLLYQQAEKSSEIFNQALANAATPADAQAIIKQYMDAATAQWQSGFDSLMASDVSGSDKVKELFAKYGIDGGKAFADAMRNNSDFEAAYDDLMVSPNVNANLQGQLKYVEQFATEYEHAFVSPLAKSSWYLSDSVLTAATALEQFKAAGIGLSSDDATSYLLEQNQAYKDYAAIQQQISDLRMHGADPKSKEILDLQNQLNTKGKALTKVINELNQAYGFKTGRNATEALNFLLNKTKASAKGAGDEVDDLDKKIKALPNRQTVTIQLKQVGGIMQSAMSSVQDQMASSAMDKFNSGWDATMASAQAAQERATNALQQRQQAAQDAMDARFQRREDAINKAYDSRIERINREIKAEQDADATRQRLFEKEKARLQAMADAENTNIDFNTQLNSGDLDEAAKTLNNAQVKTANDQMDAEQKAAEVRTQNRIDALEKKNQRLEKQRDKELKQLQKMEERMKRHLERVQNARANALAAEQEDYMNNLERRRDAEEALLEQKLELFKAFVPKNKKELDKWIGEIGLSWNTFGTDVLRKGKTWSDSFGDALRDATLQAGTEVASDNMWERVGAKMADKLLKGFGFKGIADFRNFVRTGTLSQGGGKGDKTETRHEGGVVGSGMGSRKGVPNTYKGLHRSEKMIRAQKGEYVVNKKAAAKHGNLLSAINSGTDVGGIGGLGEGGGSRLASISAGMTGDYGQGPGALAAGVMSVMLAKGINNAMSNAYNTGLAKQAALSMSATFGGQAGTYGGRSFSAEQMKNAAIIASVGSSMGMSKRDIEIGIMTAITESGLTNIRGGDRDSLGLFQQRPSMGWGSPAQIMDPKYAARAFFGPLKGHTERNDESPWIAAQHIQRSAFSDGSNYAKWWAAAQQIFSRGLTKSKGGGYSAAAGGGFVAGAGGRHRPISGPVTNGLHGGSTAGNPPAVDMAGPVGRPVYAVADGVITSSRDIAGPLASDSYNGDGPYGSFGRMITMNAAGNTILYAHLSRRSVSAGQSVKGGSVIGYSGNTGNSSGPHLHFGATNGPYAWLRQGGKVKYDNTPAMLHSGESVLTKRLTKQFEDSVGGQGGGDTFHVTLDLRGAMIKEDVDIERAVNKAIDTRESKVGRKRVVK